MTYTVHDTPAIVARIDADLADVVKAVTEADPHLISLVLTGGFARGEGAVLEGRPQNDYDFVAVRGGGRPKVPYGEVRARLEARLGLHIDLAPIARWRLGWVAGSIFWYETALRGRVVWGRDVLKRIHVRHVRQLDRTEPLRLLTNRAAGVLLARTAPVQERRLQAAKAFLAVLDTETLINGRFAPTQRERWDWYLADHAAGKPNPSLAPLHEWLVWAYTFKVEPAAAPPVDPDVASAAAAKALLASVGPALNHARLRSLDAYARRDGLVDRIYFFRRTAAIAGAHRFAIHPTGRVRRATWEMLQAFADLPARAIPAPEALVRLVGPRQDSMATLDELRHATLQ